MKKMLETKEKRNRRSKKCFRGGGGEKLDKHCAVLSSDQADEYLRVLSSHVKNNVAMTPATKARVLSALWATGKKDKVDELFSIPSFLVAPADIVKAIKLLDAGRRACQLETKILQLQKKLLQTFTKSTITKYKKRLNELNAETTALSGEVLCLMRSTRVAKSPTRKTSVLSHEVLH